MCSTCSSGNYGTRDEACETIPQVCTSMQDYGDSCTLIDGSTAYKVGDGYISETVTEYEPVGTLTYKHKNGITYTNPNYWEGAKAECISKGMRLPTAEELQQICLTRKNYPGIIPDPLGHDIWYFITSTENSDDVNRVANVIFGASKVNTSSYHDNSIDCNIASSADNGHKTAAPQVTSYGTFGYVICVEE